MEIPPYQSDCGHLSPLGMEVQSALSLQDLEAGLLQAPLRRQAPQHLGLPHRLSQDL